MAAEAKVVAAARERAEVVSAVAVMAEEESEVVVQEEVVKARAMVVTDLGVVVG